MAHLSLSALLIRFLLGGLAVVACTIVSKKLGDKAGGIFAAFPAVYLAALLTTGLDFHGGQLISHSIMLLNCGFNCKRANNKKCSVIVKKKFSVKNIRGFFYVKIGQFI